MATLVATRAAKNSETTKNSTIILQTEDRSNLPNNKDVRSLNLREGQSLRDEPKLHVIEEKTRESSTHQAKNIKMEARILHELSQGLEDSSPQNHTGASSTRLHELSLLASPPTTLNGKALGHGSGIELKDVVPNEPTNNTQLQSEAVELKERIPYATPETFIFPHWQCEQSTFQRASDVIYQLYDIIQDDTSLWSHYNDIHFRLLGCGPDVQAVQPSIVCFCKPKDVERIRQVLAAANASTINTKRRRAREFLKRIMGDKKRQILPFNIVYWVSANPPYKLLYKPLQSTTTDVNIVTRTSADISSIQPTTLCGSSVRIRSNGSMATVACMIRIDSKFYALTAAHPFVVHDLSSKQDLVPKRNPSSQTHGKTRQEDLTTVAKHIKLVQDDLKYDFPEPNMPYFGVTEDVVPQAIHLYPGEDFLQKKFRAPVTIPDLGNEDIETPDLDWALIELQDDLIWPNTIPTLRNTTDSLDLERMAMSLPEEDREVLILVANREPLRGLLLHRAAILGGVTRPGAFNVSEIGFTQGDIPLQGDSGALVVDAKTHVVYAYLIALSPFGNAYAVPLATCLQQISDTLKANEVSLPTKADIIELRDREQPYETTDISSKQYPGTVSNSTHTAATTSKSGDIISESSPLRSEKTTRDLDGLSTVEPVLAVPPELTRTASRAALPKAKESAILEKPVEKRSSQSKEIPAESHASWDLHSLTIYLWGDGEFCKYRMSLRELKNLVANKTMPLSIVVADILDYPTHVFTQESFELMLAEALQISSTWSSGWCRDSAGYFEEEIFTEEGELNGYNTWFSINVKPPQRGIQPSQWTAQQWSSTKIFTRWSCVYRQTMLLLLTPDEAVLSAIMLSMGEYINIPAWESISRERSFSPYYVLSAVAETTVYMHNVAVKQIAGLIGEIRRRSDHEEATPDEINVAMRHAIHVTGALKETYAYVTRMLAAHELWGQNHMPLIADENQQNQYHGRIQAFTKQTTHRLTNIRTGLESLLETAGLNQHRLERLSQLLIQQQLQSIRTQLHPVNVQSQPAVVQSHPGDGFRSSLARQWHRLNCLSRSTRRRRAIEEHTTSGPGIIRVDDPYGIFPTPNLPQ